jgi:hypothetical protein
MAHLILIVMLALAIPLAFGVPLVAAIAYFRTPADSGI